MYCIQCGVKLADTEKKCPLCGTIPFHPDIQRAEAEPLYPSDCYPVSRISPWGLLWVLTAVFVLSVSTTLLCDLQLSGYMNWSGYVIGALIVGYVVVVLPMWFQKPNPVLLVPCDFACVGVYLLYLNLATNGNWFLTFALPIVGFVGLLSTAIVTLTRYIRRGRLFIYGGAIVATGAFMPMMEFLLNITFMPGRYLLWSYFPMGALVLIGGYLIFLAICKPVRETMRRKFFI